MRLAVSQLDYIRTAVHAVPSSSTRDIVTTTGIVAWVRSELGHEVAETQA